MEEPTPSGRNDNFSKVIRTWQVENLIGKIMLTIETMGLQPNQEKSAKSLIKQAIWNEFNEGVYISGAMIEAAYKDNEKHGFANITQ